MKKTLIIACLLASFSTTYSINWITYSTKLKFLLPAKLYKEVIIPKLQSTAQASKTAAHIGLGIGISITPICLLTGYVCAQNEYAFYTTPPTKTELLIYTLECALVVPLAFFQLIDESRYPTKPRK